MKPSSNPQTYRQTSLHKKNNPAKLNKLRKRKLFPAGESVSTGEEVIVIDRLLFRRRGKKTTTKTQPHFGKNAGFSFLAIMQRKRLAAHGALKKSDNPGGCKYLARARLRNELMCTNQAALSFSADHVSDTNTTGYLI